MTVYGFIDGAAILKFIRETGEALAPGVEPPIAYKAVMRSLTRDRVFFYEAFPGQRPNEDDASFQRRRDEKEALFRMLNRIPSVHVRTGATSKHRKRVGIVQKGVDVQLALDV